MGLLESKECVCVCVWVCVCVRERERMSQWFVCEALQSQFKKYWKVLETGENRVATHSRSEEEKTNTVCARTHTHSYTHTHIPSANMNVPSHYLCRTGPCKGTRHRWEGCHSSQGAGFCKASKTKGEIHSANCAMNNNDNNKKKQEKSSTVCGQIFFKVK